MLIELVHMLSLFLHFLPESFEPVLRLETRENTFYFTVRESHVLLCLLLFNP